MHWHYLRDRQDQKLWQKITSSFLTLALIVTREVGSLILFLIWGNVNTGICWKNVQNFIQKGDTLQKHRLYLGCRLNYGSVAQLVERRTVWQGAKAASKPHKLAFVGSIPTSATNISYGQRGRVVLATSSVRQTTCTSQRCGPMVSNQGVFCERGSARS